VHRGRGVSEGGYSVPWKRCGAKGGIVYSGRGVERREVVCRARGVEGREAVNRGRGYLSWFSRSLSCKVSRTAA
jgi:hypothetical protein